jgi:hypothetical protein
MTANVRRELPVVALLPYKQNNPCFALPLFSHPESGSNFFIQEVDEVHGVIGGFKVLDEFDSSDVTSIVGPLAQVGQGLVQAFITEDGISHVGTISELEPTLRAFVNRCPNQIGTVLQVIELIGTEADKKMARAKMRTRVIEKAGASSARAFYEGSALRTALWNCLVTLADDESTARRMLRVRAKLDATITPNGLLDFDLSALDPQDLMKINRDDLTQALLRQFETIPGQSPESWALFEIKQADSSAAEQVSQLLWMVAQTGRQEERFAILANSVLENRSIGMAALMQYGSDRGQTAAWAIRELRGKLEGVRESLERDELVVADLVHRLFTRHYPQQRGYLLYVLAKHLAKWPNVNGSIRRTLDSTRSVYVHDFRREIGLLLDGGKGATR